MAAALLLLMMSLFQGIPIAPQVGGNISGLLTDAEGKPAAGVRVSAMTRLESPGDVTAVALVSIVETDEQGRYTLESIPPGLYYILAGSVDRPTYFPGTQDMSSARVLQVTAGARMSGLDFVVSESSRRVPFVFMNSGSGVRYVRLPLRVVADAGVRVPVSTAAGPVTLEFERIPDRVIASVSIVGSESLLELHPGSTSEYRIRVRNLPEEYAVETVHYGSVDISAGLLRFSRASAITIGAIGPAELLTVKIGKFPVATPSARLGVRVTGIGRRSDTHPVYLSGRPATVFADGSFEFRGVPPGRHTIALIDAPGRARGTTIVVGDRDVEGVSLDDVAALPRDIQTPVSPQPAGTSPPGMTFSPVAIKGRVSDRLTREAPPSGQVYISGRNGPSYPLDTKGRFEIPRLLPGTYAVEVRVRGYSEVIREITVGIEDVNAEFEITK
jgi:hypothetical protein